MTECVADIQPQNIECLKHKPNDKACTVARFKRKVRFIPEADGCWEWTGRLSTNGYGRFFLYKAELEDYTGRADSKRGAEVAAHRWLWRVWKQLDGIDISDIDELDHRCRNRRCVYPRHLEVVSPQVNSWRANSHVAKAERAGQETLPEPECTAAVSSVSDGDCIVPFPTRTDSPPEVTEAYYAAKHDQGKLDWSLLPWPAIEQVVAVLTYGAVKYKRDGWKAVPDAVQRYEAAMLRHFVRWKRGELLDPESNLPHLAHMLCNLVFLMELTSDKSE